MLFARAVAAEVSFVLYHEELGVFLGMTDRPLVMFWSRHIEVAPLDVAPCWDDREVMFQMVREWGGMPAKFLEKLQPRAVIADVFPGADRKFASARACAAAGLPGWLSEHSVGVDVEIVGDDADSAAIEPALRSRMN